MPLCYVGLFCMSKQVTSTVVSSFCMDKTFLIWTHLISQRFKKTKLWGWYFVLLLKDKLFSWNSQFRFFMLLYFHLDSFKLVFSKHNQETLQGRNRVSFMAHLFWLQSAHYSRILTVYPPHQGVMLKGRNMIKRHFLRLKFHQLLLFFFNLKHIKLKEHSLT